MGSKQDNIWKCWNIHSKQDFDHFLPRIEFHPQVDKEVTQRFDLVRKLIHHSYHEYDFLDAAYERALLTLEMSLHRRHIELEGTPSEHTLTALISWGQNRGLFEDQKRITDGLVNLRNHVGHLKAHYQVGYLALGLIQRIIEIINDLYEDDELRKKRKREIRCCQRILKQVVNDGAILEWQKQRLIIFRAELLWFENRLSPHRYYFLFWPLFDPIEKEESVKICDPLVICCDMWKTKENTLVFHEINDDGELRLLDLSKSEDECKYRDWKQLFDQSSFPLQQFVEIEIGKRRMEVRCLYKR